MRCPNSTSSFYRSFQKNIDRIVDLYFFYFVFQLRSTVILCMLTGFQVKRNKHKRIKVLSDDDDSDNEATNENDADMVANQIFGEDDDEDGGPADHDESSQQSAGGKGGEDGNQYGDLDESEESGMPPIASSLLHFSFAGLMVPLQM